MLGELEAQLLKQIERSERVARHSIDRDVLTLLKHINTWPRPHTPEQRKVSTAVHNIIGALGSVYNEGGLARRQVERAGDAP